jgi:hypothetical protein
MPPTTAVPPAYALITGASAGLGLELARLFAADGFPLILTARNSERLEALAHTLSKDHEVEVRVLPADLCAPGSARALLDALQEEGLGVRVLVNNAGFGATGEYLERGWDTYRDMIRLNVEALAELTHGLLPGMVRAAAGTDPLRARYGRPGVMNVASTAAFQPGPTMAVYFATKSFVLHFSEALHEEMRGRGVTITAFCPGPTRTEFFKQGSMVPGGEMSEAARKKLERRDARRMDAGQAAASGYQGFRQGKAIAVPGLVNSLLTMAGRFLPRAVVRRVTKQALKKT